MASTINTNVQSLVSQRALSNVQNSMATSMSRLSSGLRVNSAKDDAAGLAIAERMQAQVKGMNVAVRNANDGISLAQTAEGAMGQVGNILQRMRELAVQAANGSNSASDLSSLNQEYQQLNSEITRSFEATTFNGKKILSTEAGALSFQVGANKDASNQITITTQNMATQADIAAVGATVLTGGGITGAGGVLEKLDTAIDKITSERATLGAAQSRFEVATQYLTISSENQSAARSRIMDADFAVETANLSRSQILSQAASAMLAQANQMPQSVLSLIRG